MGQIYLFSPQPNTSHKGIFPHHSFRSIGYKKRVVASKLNSILPDRSWKNLLFSGTNMEKQLNNNWGTKNNNTTKLVFIIIQMVMKKLLFHGPRLISIQCLHQKYYEPVNWDFLKSSVFLL